MKDVDRIMRIMAKTSILLLVVIVGYWGHYFYDEIKWKRESKERFREYFSRPVDSTTRGGYAQPSYDSIPNTLRPDTLKTDRWNF